ncbi:uncharacterized protein [Chironomus tepperi]|uniref:uncharacterized protein n=1 Tax=Chironomus tepperi TaxID=113505 RepID=UPI00391F749F
MYKKNTKIDRDAINLQNAKIKFVKAESQLKFSEDLINKNVSTLWRQSVDKLEVKRIVETLENSIEKEEFVELKSVSIAKFLLDESLTDEKCEILYKISEKWTDRSIVVIFSSNDKEQCMIYWKTKELHNFLTFKFHNDEPLKFGKDLRKFIAEFLIISLDNGHSGLHRCCTLSYGRNQIELNYLADSRDYNLLFIASEQGYASVVNSLLDFGISSEIPGIDVNPQSLAWNNRHFDVLLVLLHANMTYPASFNTVECSEELKEFVEVANDLHKYIIEQDEEKIKKIIQQYPNLRYFYNTNNESAPKIALMHNLIDIYVILITNKIFFGTHEDTEEIMNRLTYDDRRKIREIHFKELQDLPEKHINILVAHAFVGHDSHDVKTKLDLVINAFRVLNKIPGIREILIVTSASKKFNIIFDFNRDSVQLMDPTVSSDTSGLFYLSGRIYIGAKQLLDSKTEAITFGTLAHELSHYAMYLTYHNDAKPYKEKDIETKNEVEEISALCEKQKEVDDVILMVYNMYSKEQEHAELIVRIPHLLALYHDNPEKIKSLRIIFDKLFKFYENKIVPEMIESVPEIESKIEKEIEKKDRKISKLQRYFICFAVLGVLVTGLFGFLLYYHYSTNYKFDELSESDQTLVKNSLVNYRNVTIKFSDMFNDKEAYNNLESNHIAQMLDGDTLNLNDLHLFYLDSYIKFNWTNLAPKLKDEFLKSNATFQNESLSLMKVYQEVPEIFAFLNSSQIKTVLDKNDLSIGKMIKNSTKFCVERKFIYEDMNVIYSNYTANSGNIPFKTFMDNFLNRSVDDIIHDVKHYINVSTVIDPLDYSNLDVQSYFKDSNTVINETDKSKFFILSSEAGSGKSYTFVQFALTIKKKFPTRWVSYIHLRKYVDVYEKLRSKNMSLDSVQELLQELLGVNTRNAFEYQLFKERFKLGKMVLIWDGFDEIASEYDQFIIDVLKFIKLNTNITQYISTRTTYSTVLRRNFKTISFILVPFDKTKQHEFLQKLLSSENFNETFINQKIERITKIFKPIVSSKNPINRASRELNTPLMLILTTEISEDNDFEDNPNIFYIYKKFIQKKINAKYSAQSNLLGDSKFVLAQYFQKFALKDIFLFVSFKMKLNRLQIMKMKLPNEVKNNDISQIGILYLTDETEYEFAHKSFAEFFFAQYIIDNIYDSNDIDNEAELSLRLELFFTYLFSRNERGEYITSFLKHSLLEYDKTKQENFNYKISDLLKTKFKSRFLKLLRKPNEVLVKFMIDFFKKDHDLLIDLLGINQIETFYTSQLKPSFESCRSKPDYLKNLMHMPGYLTHDEYTSFINGVDQNGTILFGKFYCHKLGKWKIGAELSDDEIFNHTSFINFFDALNETLNQNEQIEMYKTAVDPSLYFVNLHNNKIFTTFSISNYQYLWEKFQNLAIYNTIVLRSALGNAIAKCVDIDIEMFNTDELLSILLNKTKELLDSESILAIFNEKKLLFKAIRQFKQFKIFWNFIIENLNKDQQREILQNIYDEDNEESGCYFKIFSFNTFTFCFSGFKVFHFSLLVEQQEIFNYVRNIYEVNFGKEQLQTIALSSVDIYLYMIAYESVESCCYFALYLKNLFEGNYKTLHKFLIGKYQQTSINLIEYFQNYRPIKSLQLKAFESLKNITESMDSSRYDYCDSLLKNISRTNPTFGNERALKEKIKSKNPFLP